MDFYQILILGAAAAASSIIANGVAVGSGIFVLPVLALVFPPKIALGLGAPMMFASNLVGMKIYWGEWDDWRELARTLAAATLGIIAGSWLLNAIPNNLFKLGIGGFAICFSLYELLKASSLWKVRSAESAASERSSSPISCALIGLFGGIASALAHAGGMVWSMYYVRRGLDKRCFVSSLLFLFFLSNLFKILAYLKIGILSMESTLVVLAMSPIIILCSLFGSYLNKKIRPEPFRKAVLLLILAAGIMLVAG